MWGSAGLQKKQIVFIAFIDEARVAAAFLAFFTAFIGDFIGFGMVKLASVKGRQDV